MHVLSGTRDNYSIQNYAQVERLKSTLSEAKSSEDGLREDISAAARRMTMLNKRHATTLEEVHSEGGGEGEGAYW